MKSIFIFSLVFSFVFSGYSQISIRMGNEKPVKQQVLDTAAIQVFYETLSVPDSLHPDKTVKDYLVLQIGRSGVSKFYSDNVRRRDSIMGEMIKRNPTQIDMKRVMDDHGIGAGGDERVIFKNYPAGKITVTDRVVSTDYLYEENLDEIQWNILPDTMTCLSYSCQKAETDFRGRHYEAWFTPDFPVSEGPWKFGGLPGLILRMEDSQKNFVFQATGLEQSGSLIYYPQKDYLKTSRKEVDKIKRRFIENPMEYIKSSLPGANIQIKMKNEDGSESTGKDIKFPYNPMELN